MKLHLPTFLLMRQFWLRRLTVKSFMHGNFLVLKRTLVNDLISIYKIGATIPVLYSLRRTSLECQTMKAYEAAQMSTTAMNIINKRFMIYLLVDDIYRIYRYHFKDIMNLYSIIVVPGDWSGTSLRSQTIKLSRHQRQRWIKSIKKLMGSLLGKDYFSTYRSISRTSMK